MKIMKHCLFIFAASAHMALYSQVLNPVSLNCMGRSLSNGNLIIRQTISAAWRFPTIATPTLFYTQGFIQPDAGTTTEVPHINDVSLGEGSYLLDALGGTPAQFEDDLMVEYSLGEIATKTQTISTHMLTQGVLQPFYW